MSAPLYVTLADLKATLNITGTANDSDLTDCISAASRAIDQDCNRRFYADADALQVRRFVPDNPGFCLIDDLATLTSLQFLNDVWVLDQDFYLTPINTEADGFPFTAIRTIARPFIFTKAEVASGWVAFDNRVTVTGKWGWPTATPPEIVQATKILAAKLFKRPKDAPFSVVGIGATGATIHTGRFDPEYDALVDPYRRRLWFG